MSETTTSSTATGEGAAAGTGQAPDTAAANTAPPAGDPSGQDHTATIARLERDLDAARKEAGKARTQAKANAADEARKELAQQIGQALGLVEDDTPPDPATLTQQLTEVQFSASAAQEDALAARIELQVYRTAHRLGANAEQLLDSRAFVDSIDSLDADPADAKAFTAAVEAKIGEAMESNPRMRAQSAGPARGGAEFNGPPSAGVTAQQFAGMDYSERAAIFQSDPETYRRLAGTQ